MTTFTTIYSAIHERDAEHAKSAARRRLLEETNAVVQYKHMSRTEATPNGDDAYTVGIEFEPSEQVVEHSADWWIDQFSIAGTVEEGTVDGHELFE